MAKNDLVILESPNKIKAVSEYLGSGYKVTASKGHLRDLPKSKFGVEIGDGFVPVYVPVKGSEEMIESLKKAAKNAKHVYLATDPDREGEAIAWHIKELLDLTDDKALRVTFNEITKKAVQESIKNPRNIDGDLVNAQQTRRILDRIVGYQLSPLLWKKIRRGLSAGRVQSVVVRIVVDREEEIRAFVPEEYWHLDVVLKLEKGGAVFTARYHGTKKKEPLNSAEEVERVVSAISVSPFKILDVKRVEKKRNPSPPFITSSLQQEASRKLSMTPRRTMSIAQQLYEGVDIKGEGTVGLITYMRTDSLRISEEALSDAEQLVRSRYGADYYPGQPTRYRVKSGAQDAHEAIRPSNVNLIPENIKPSLTQDQFRLYKLIWSRFLASQMSQAVYDSVTVDAESAGYVFRANHTALKFAGFTAVYIEGTDEEEEPAASPLPTLSIGDAAKLTDIRREQKFTQPPPRFTEATLIRAMEESGVGRPSTYAPMISTVTDREYVVKEGKSLRPTPLGEVVTQLMKERFADIVDLKFTARMEESLDSVEKGEADWQEVLAKFYGGFSDVLTAAEQSLEGERIKIPDEVSEEVCDLCGRQLVVKSGRFGRFLACPGYPDCNFTKPLVVEMPGKCPLCAGRILKRTSKKGYAYYECEKRFKKTCEFWTFEVPVADNCPECGKTMFKKSGRGMKRPFCINAECSMFLPEEQRGYRKKTTETGTENAEDKTEKTEDKPEKKTAKRSAAKKETTTKEAVKKTAKTTKAKSGGKTGTAKKTSGSRTRKTEQV